jgi:hypothetical protein
MTLVTLVTLLRHKAVRARARVTVESWKVSQASPAAFRINGNDGPLTH